MADSLSSLAAAAVPACLHGGVQRRVWAGIQVAGGAAPARRALRMRSRASWFMCCSWGQSASLCTAPGVSSQCDLMHADFSQRLIGRPDCASVPS